MAAGTDGFELVTAVLDPRPYRAVDEARWAALRGLIPDRRAPSERG